MNTSLTTLVSFGKYLVPQFYEPKPTMCLMPTAAAAAACTFFRHQPQFDNVAYFNALGLKHPCLHVALFGDGW
jgi:hypothetical protein